MNEVLITVSFSYGGYTFWFEKLVHMDVPFYGMVIRDGEDEEFELKLNNDQWRDTTIEYSLFHKKYTVTIRNRWHTLSSNAIDQTIERFEKYGWKRGDMQDVAHIKSIIKAAGTDPD